MVQLPAGTVTLLFTDVEGSTRLARSLRDRWPDVLADHQRLLRGAFAEAGGREIDSHGDAFLVAFSRARDAVSAAVLGQRAIYAHEWPKNAELRVRMGIHTGEPTVGAERYVGLGVHRGARIADSGHGGQVLLSSATRAVVEDDLPADVGLLDLGERRLKDLERPERVYQLVIEGLPSDFPPPRTGAADEEAVRVVLAEDSVLLREGIARLLTDAGLEVVGQVGNADDLLRRIGFSKPDVAIVDIRMPPTHTDEGLRAAREIRTRHPGLGVLVLSQYVEPQYAMDLLAETAEGTGYLLKDRISDVEDFVAAVRRVAQGGSALDPAVVSQLVGRTRHDDPLAELTPREREVLSLMAEGLSNAGIAERLVVTERAVEKHVTSIFGKLGLTVSAEDHRRVRAVLLFLRS
jgi:DNA-binding NarL/FixJ family response regulator/class 3 adenylate cyclase